MVVKYIPTSFGLMLEYPIPDGCDMAILCVDLLQHTPINLLLPHQVYREKLQELLKQHPGARGITIIPCRSADKISLPASEMRG